MWIASNLERSHLLREVTVKSDIDAEEDELFDCPSIEHLIANCRVHLSLDLWVPCDGHDTFRYICVGIEGAASLPGLELGLASVPEEIAVNLLQCLGRNQSLTSLMLRFTVLVNGYSYVPEIAYDGPEVGTTLQSFISNNSNVTTFHLLMQSEDGGFQHYHLFAIRGLKKNRKLRVLQLSGSMTASTSAELVNVLQTRNTKLVEIESLGGYDSEADKAEVDRLLQLNRYGQGFVPDVDFDAIARQVPIELWGDVLSRIGTDECNRFVLELVQRAVWGQPAEVSPPPSARRSRRKRSCT
jgi:hypothetical protein